MVRAVRVQQDAMAQRCENDEICIQNEKLCIKNEEFCIKTDEFWRKGDDLSSCKTCTGEATAAVLCPTCGETAELHHGGCCAGTDIGTFSGSHKGNDRPHARPLAVISFPSAGS